VASVQTGASPKSASSTRAHWWSAAPFAQLPPIGAARAYAEVLGVFAAFFATGVIAAVLSLDGYSKYLLSRGSWGVFGPAAVQAVTQAGLAVVVVLCLSARRRVRPADLGWRLERRSDGSVDVAKMVRIAAWAAVALVSGGFINAALQTGQLKLRTNTPELVFGVFDSLNAGIVEELVVLAFVVITLKQAGRPLWEIVAVALVLRASYHIYYGPGVVGILVWAAMYLWIYLRFRNLPVLVAAHFAWDLVSFLGQAAPWLVGVAVLVGLALVVAAPITWLAQRPPRVAEVACASGGPQPHGSPSSPVGTAYSAGDQRGPWPGGSFPPGWYPDPYHQAQWRWWDGQGWSAHVAGLPRS